MIQGRRISIKRTVLSLLVYIMMGINRAVILIVPFKRLAVNLGEQITEDLEVIWDVKRRRRAEALKRIIENLSRYTPWESKCYVQALTAAQIMKIFHIDGIMHFGVRKDSDGLKAHAWIVGDECIVTGEAGMEGFVSVAKFWL